MFQKIVRVLGGDPNKREIERDTVLVDQINSLEPALESLGEEELRAKTDEFRSRLSQGETLDDLLPEAFAAVREASKRTLGLRHFDVQMIGGITLHTGKIAEMRTGEGKTLVATLPIYLNALTGKGVHLVTVNDYLARRDARWMSPIYQSLGMNVGVLQMAARTENGRMAFLVDLEKTSPHEDQHQLRMVPRREAYQADITYGTNSEFGFDYLRDNLTMRLEDRVQRGHYYAIIDEVDNILIDEARTPLIISGPASEDTEWYARMAQVVRQLNPEDYEVSEKDHTVSLTEIGEAHVEQLLEQPLRDPDRPEDITPEQARLLGYLEQGLRAQFLFRRNKDYLVQGGKVVIVDEFTGRLMPGRRWSDGLHQAVEAKEGVKVEPENVTYATITLQNYFRMYGKLAGMTGTALTEAEEFYKIYKLDVLPIPTNLEFVATRSESPLMEVEARDEDGYRYAYYARRGDTAKAPVFWRRKDYPDLVYRTQEAKLRAITQEILHYHIRGRPQLVGTTSVEHSERLSGRLRPEPIRRLLQTMLLRQVWLEKNNRQDDERAIPELTPLYRSLDDLQAPDLRQMARSLDLPLNPEDPANLSRLIRLLDLQPGDEARLVSVLQGGVAHQVLNARKHDEESQIIARAGAFGAVTIATNMAGRGVDIKLGGELPEEVLGDANRALVKGGFENAYDMTHSERRQALLSIDLAEAGLYEEGARAFLEYLDNMERVRELGGLHVIGSERHEARRIDNQLRGRAARQGDPGSSRFYLALDDDLMRLFGGQQVEGLLTRLNIDEAVPIESGVVGRLVEQSQTRVEGANFDVRKHLLEYDDVLNSQRARIYSQRDQVFTKEDLRDDVAEMLQAELQKRIPEALKDEEGPWKLLAYLDEIQPALEYEDVIYPSYTQRLLLYEVSRHIEEAAAASGGRGTQDGQGAVLQALLSLAERTLDMEHEHLMKAAHELMDRSEETLQTQIDERMDALETLVEGWKDTAQEEGETPRRPQELAEELSSVVRMPVRLTPEQNRLLTSDPEQVAEAVGKQVSMQLMALMANRLVGSFERRLEESLNLRTIQIQEADWNQVREALLQALEETLTRRRERVLGSRGQESQGRESQGQETQGQIARDLSQMLPRDARDLSDEQLIRMLGAMARGTRVAFDRKTHRQSWQYTTRLRYSFLAARLVQDQPAQSVTADVLEHLEQAQVMIGRMWGKSEWNRLLQAEATLGQLTGNVKEEIEAVINAKHGDGTFTSLENTSLQAFSAEDRDVVVEILGRRVLSELYRQLVLSVVSELWVDYLTRVEALRVSIGLEAYAQRDPLVQYKSQATEMFSNLITNVRSGVISRMFTYRPRQVSAAAAVAAPPVEGSVGDGPAAEVEATDRAAAAASTPAGGSGGRHKKKRKRH